MVQVQVPDLHELPSGNPLVGAFVQGLYGIPHCREESGLGREHWTSDWSMHWAASPRLLEKPKN